MTKIEKKKPTGKKILLITVACILAFVILVLLGARIYFRLPVSRYYRNSEKGFAIPGLQDGFIPQGLDFDERSECFFVTGYMDDGSASPVYLVDKENLASGKTVFLATADGESFTGHAGGISVYEDYVYVAGGADYCIYVYSYEDIIDADDGARISCLGAISTGSKEDGVRVSCLALDGDYIYAVEFYHEPKYPTQESHKMTTDSGDYQQALAIAYALSDETDSVFGVDLTPVFGFSLPDCVQGMCFRDGEIYISTSYGASFSHVYSYDSSRIAYQKDIAFQGVELPIYALDSNAMLQDIKLPPMSEEIVFVDDRLYTMCESASNKYFFGKLTSAKWCYATDVDTD